MSKLLPYSLIAGGVGYLCLQVVENAAFLAETVVAHPTLLAAAAVGVGMYALNVINKAEEAAIKAEFAKSERQELLTAFAAAFRKIGASLASGTDLLCSVADAVNVVIEPKVKAALQRAQQAIARGEPAERAFRRSGVPVPAEIALVGLWKSDGRAALFNETADHLDKLASNLTA